MSENLKEKVMKRIFNLFMLFFLTISIFGCEKVKENTENKDLKATKFSLRDLKSRELDLVEANNQFAWELFSEVLKQNEGEKDVLISPLSISIALSMTCNGAHGDTKTAIVDTLGLSNFSHFRRVNRGYKDLIKLLTTMDPDVQLNLANSVWIRDSFPVNPIFIKNNKRFFNARVTSLDFNRNPEAADTMNAWINDATNGLIEELIEPPININTVLFLINTIYFKGNWTVQFDRNLTSSREFHAPDGDMIVNMMKNGGNKLSYFETDTYQAIDLSYGNGNFKMMVLLPGEGISTGQIIDNFNQKTWTDLVNSMVSTKVDLYLPKFKLEYDIKMNDVLKALGMEIAFSNEADFSGINSTSGKSLYISEVKHKSFIKVDEEGTEAAAATSVEITRKMMKQIMNVNRPFIIVLHDVNSKTILFVGQVNRPQED